MKLSYQDLSMSNRAIEEAVVNSPLKLSMCAVVLVVVALPAAYVSAFAADTNPKPRLGEPAINRCLAKIEANDLRAKEGQRFYVRGEDLKAFHRAMAGVWAGTYYSPQYPGSITMTLEVDEVGTAETEAYNTALVTAHFEARSCHRYHGEFTRAGHIERMGTVRLGTTGRGEFWDLIMTKVGPQTFQLRLMGMTLKNGDPVDYVYEREIPALETLNLFYQ